MADFKREVGKNFIFNFFYQFINIMVPFVTTPYVTRILGSESLGIYGFTISVSAYFIYFGSLGTTLYGQRQIAFFQNDKAAYSKTFLEIFILRLIGMTISMVAFGIVFVGIGGPYSVYYKILMLELLGGAIDVSWLYHGLERFGTTVSRNSVVKIISVIAIFTFVKGENDLWIYFLIYAGSVLVGNLSLWVTLPELVTWQECAFADMKAHFLPIVKLFIPQVAIQIYTIFDKTMLGLLVPGKSEVGYYDQSQKLIRAGIVLVTALGTVMLPRVSAKFASGDRDDINDSIQKSFQVVTAMAVPLSLGVIVVSDSFVPWFLGNGFLPAVNIMKIIAPVILFIAWSNVIGVQFLLPTKKENAYTFSVLVGACVNFVANLIFIPRLGGCGAALGTVIAEASVVLAQVMLTRKEWDYGKIAISLLPYLCAGGLMYLGCAFVPHWIAPGVVCMAVQIVVGAVIYCGSLGVLYLIYKRGKKIER